MRASFAAPCCQLLISLGAMSSPSLGRDADFTSLQFPESNKKKKKATGSIIIEAAAVFDPWLYALVSSSDTGAQLSHLTLFFFKRSALYMSLRFIHDPRKGYAGMEASSLPVFPVLKTGTVSAIPVISTAVPVAASPADQPFP